MAIRYQNVLLMKSKLTSKNNVIKLYMVTTKTIFQNSDFYFFPSRHGNESYNQIGS